MGRGNVDFFLLRFHAAFCNLLIINVSKNGAWPRPAGLGKRLRGYVLMLFAVPYFCPWKCQEQINMGAKETGTTCE